MADLQRRFQILLSDEQFDFLKELSHRRRRSIADLIRFAVERLYRPASRIEYRPLIAHLLKNSYIDEKNFDEILRRKE